MGVMLESVFFGVLVGVLAALPVVLYRRETLPALARRGARPAAYVLAAIPPVASVLLTIAWVMGFDLGIQFSVPWLFLLSLLGMASRPLVGSLITMTGGEQTGRSTAERDLLDHLEAASRSLQAGDEEAWRAALSRAASLWVPTAAAVQQAIRPLLAVSWRTGGTAVPELLGRLEAAARLRWAAPAAARGIASLGIFAAFIGTAMPIVVLGVAGGRACVDANALLADSPASTAISLVPIGVAVPGDPEPGAQLTWEGAMDLEVAAESRHDPNTRELLEEAGFRVAFLREWEASDGRRIHADAFEFATREGALAYQRQVTEYACRFANLAFPAGDGGIGLRVRYGSGDPIVEQVSWVAGSRRHVVSVSHLDDPADHDRILAILERARR